MKPGSIFEWLRPMLGAVLMLAGAGGLAYKVIGGYRHATPDSFVRVQDRDKVTAASAAQPPAEVQPVPADATAAAQVPPISTAPPPARGPSTESASSAAADAVSQDETQDNSVCTAIKTEQLEINGALKKQNSPEQSRYMQRRLRDLAEQHVAQKCAE